MTNADIGLAVMLDRQAIDHEAAANRARQERRAVWLRLHEEGMRYEDLQRHFGYGTTTFHTELRRAREERAAANGGSPATNRAIL